MDGYKTILEVSNDLGITRQAIQKKLTKNFRSKYVKKQKGKLYISATGVAALEGNHSNDYSNFDNQKQPKVQPDENELLLRLQLQKKDEQIDRLTTLLDQQQQLQLDMQRKYDRLQLQLVENTQETNDSKDSNKGATSATKVAPNHWWKFW